MAEEGAVVDSHYIIMKAINLYLGKLGVTQYGGSDRKYNPTFLGP